MTGVWVVLRHTTFRVLRCAGAHGGCGRLAFVGSFSHRDRAGISRLRFTGRLRGRALTAGRYVLRATATLAGRRTRAATARFVILALPPECHNPDHDADCGPPGAGSSPRQAADTSDRTATSAQEHGLEQVLRDEHPAIRFGSSSTLEAAPGRLASLSGARGTARVPDGGAATCPVVGRGALTQERGAGRR
jgi:hypothetical protein